MANDTKPETTANDSEEIGNSEYLELAREVYGSNNIEIDDDADFSEGNDGTWVQAWVFLSKKRLKKAGLWNDED